MSRSGGRCEGLSLRPRSLYLRSRSLMRVAARGDLVGYRDLGLSSPARRAASSDRTVLYLSGEVWLPCAGGVSPVLEQQLPCAGGMSPVLEQQLPCAGGGKGRPRPRPGTASLGTLIQCIRKGNVRRACLGV